MANAEIVLDKKILAVLTGQINERIASVAGKLLTPQGMNSLQTDSAELAETDKEQVRRKVEIDLGETFAVWMLGGAAINRGVRSREDLMTLAKDTGSWHHQIRFDHKGMAYARSMALKDKARTLCELSVSALAEEIQRATDWSDQNVSDEYLMRLLLVPSRQVRAFWFIDQANRRSQVYVTNAPARIKKLKKHVLLSSEEFLEALGKERISGYR